MNPLSLFVTGASGFIGSALINRLAVSNVYNIRSCVRCKDVSSLAGVNLFLVKDLSVNTDWREALLAIDVVVHLAGRAHVLSDRACDPLTEFRKVNVEGTLNLARQAVDAGVKRFIFISSIGVNGNHNSCPFTENDIPNPVDSYAISKLEAEKGLRALSVETNMEVVIIRPPLVYGFNAPGNFGRLMRVVSKGVPLPLGTIYNKRSFVAIDNLVDLIMTCIDHPAAANQTFLVGDGEDLSTTELLRRLGIALGNPVRLVPVPEWLLKIGLNAVGKGDIAQRLCGSLHVDISKARNVLGWEPPVSVDEGLKRTAEWYLKDVVDSRQLAVGRKGSN